MQLVSLSAANPPDSPRGLSSCVQAVRRKQRRTLSTSTSRNTPPEPATPQDTLALYQAAAGDIPNAEPITPEEVQLVLDTTMAGKSTGPDGVPYELMFSIMQTTLQPKFIACFNSVLHQERPIPERWLKS